MALMHGDHATRAKPRAAALLGLALLAACTAVRADSGLATVHSQTFTRHLTAYAQVRPAALSPLRATQPGQVTGLPVQPGDSVQAGEVLGHLTGPETQARLARDHAAVEAAQADLDVARQTLSAQRHKRTSQLSTREDVYRAQAAVSHAQSRLQTAQATLKADRQSTELRAPAAGAVVSVQAGEGERVAAGQKVLTVQPAGGLWLRAAYYGADAEAVHVGMRGRFVPADGSTPVSVTVAALIPTADPDGGRAVRLRGAAPNPGWHAGQAGMVELRGRSHTAVAVPTRALILDRGRWWVLVHTARGDQPRQVEPGPARDGRTVIRKGLSNGEQVVVEQAYARYHHNFSQQYQQPD